MGRDIASWIEFWAQRQPERIALHFGDRNISYGALLARIRVLVTHLGQCGTAPGDRIGYLGANHPEMVALTFACARTGTIFVPLNWRLSATELAAILGDCKPAMLICDPEFADTGATIASGGDTVVALLRTCADVWLDCAWPASPQRAAPSPTRRHGPCG